MRSRTLDGARGFGFLLVLFAHVDPQRFMLLGIIGVAFFFALSGFLITRQITRETNIRRYYWRRLVRIMPLAYLYLAINGALAAAAGLSMSGYAWHFAFLSDWLLTAQAPTFTGGFVGHLWTIAVEVQFYMLWPAVLLVAGRRRVPVLIGIMVAALLWRLAVTNPYAATITLPSRVDAFAAGAIAALLPAGRWRIIAVGTGALVLVAAFVAMGPTDFANPLDWGSKAAFLLTGLALVFGPSIPAIEQRAPRFLSNAALVWSGERAYSLYIWHVPVLAAAEKLPLPFAWQIVLALVGIAGTAWASHRFIEAQLTGWLSNLFEPRAQTPLIRPSKTSAA